MIGTVEIAGGGIAGLTTGLAFARKGWRVRVHEQDPDLRILGAGIYIWENGLRVLDALGALSAVVGDAVPAWRHEKRDHDGSVFIQSRLGSRFRLYVPLRESLLVGLYDTLIDAGGEVVFNSRAIAADPRGDLLFEDGSKARADLVIAADGINSPIRDALGLLRWRRPANQFGYRAMIRRAPGDLSSEIGRSHCEHWHGSRRLLYAPCTAHEAYVQLTSLKGDTAANRMPIDREFWSAQFPHLAWIIERIPDDGRGDWFEIIRLRDWSSGRVALVGDSASAQPPFLGQGGGCAMMSGFALAEAIERCGNVIDGIDAWQRRERAFTEWVQRVAYWYGQLARLPPAARTAAFRALDATEWLKGATLLVAARHDPTADAYWRDGNDPDSPFVLPLLH
ncbi:MAG TPA: NAD(P)/FAD-dependent oxidoreductase [Stellaceae bacterium]|jgi:2-polyprenyl-6-methoxyphenol hydroxylase-like FAD-dependent oxidoreductase|nr:NAD(P)/FAD-dependent oxidoreductase [Stellaceae bacterium]